MYVCAKAWVDTISKHSRNAGLENFAIALSSWSAVSGNNGLADHIEIKLQSLVCNCQVTTVAIHKALMTLPSGSTVKVRLSHVAEFLPKLQKDLESAQTFVEQYGQETSSKDHIDSVILAYCNYSSKTSAKLLLYVADTMLEGILEADKCIPVGYEDKIQGHNQKDMASLCDVSWIM
jgi:hypothetical protein